MLEISRAAARSRMFALIWPYRGEAVFLFVLSALSVASEIGGAYITKKLIDGLVEAFRVGVAVTPAFIAIQATGIVLTTIFSEGTRLIYGYRLYHLGTQLKDGLRIQAYQQYLQLHALFHHQTSSGEMMSRIDRGADGMMAVVGQVVGWYIFPPFIKFSAVFAALLWYSPTIALTVLAPLPVYLFVVRLMTMRIEKVQQRLNELNEKTSKYAHDVAGNILTVKKFAHEEMETDEHIRLMKIARSEDLNSEWMWLTLNISETIISALGRLLVLGISGMLLIRGELSIGELVFFLSLQQMAYGPLSSLAYAFPRYRRNMVRVERVFALLEEERFVQDAENAQVLPRHVRDIAFQDVSFAYREGGSPVLKHVSATLPAGKTIALVGRSGSGKTTFVNLLMRSFDPTEGSILIDGHNIAQVTRASLLGQMAVVPQEVDLFSRTIRENITYGSAEADSKAVEIAAKSALAHDFILKTENGYDTMVGSRGLKLSGGERQRVGIARAILRDPRILVLDEATSHLDTESERLITEATEHLIKGRTTFIIAHRLSTILHADTILVFADGKIEAQGTHKELLKKSKTYQMLSKAQFKDA